MDIKVLGMGCVNCNNLEMAVFNVVAELGIDANIEKVDDLAKIMSYGVMSPPGLVINGKAKASGRVPSKAELKQLIQAEL